MFMGRKDENDIICALHAIDVKFLARIVIRTDKGPIDYVIQGVVEFLRELGRKRVTLMSDKKPAIKSLVTAIVLHREEETLTEEIPVDRSR